MLIFTVMYIHRCIKLACVCVWSRRLRMILMFKIFRAVVLRVNVSRFCKSRFAIGNLGSFWACIIGSLGVVLAASERPLNVFPCFRFYNRNSRFASFDRNKRAQLKQRFRKITGGGELFSLAEISESLREMV